MISFSALKCQEMTRAWVQHGLLTVASCNKFHWMGLKTFSSRTVGKLDCWPIVAWELLLGRLPCFRIFLMCWADEPLPIPWLKTATRVSLHFAMSFHASVADVINSWVWIMRASCHSCGLCFGHLQAVQHVWKCVFAGNRQERIRCKLVKIAAKTPWSVGVVGWQWTWWNRKRLMSCFLAKWICVLRQRTLLPSCWGKHGWQAHVHCTILAPPSLLFFKMLFGEAETIPTLFLQCLVIFVFVRVIFIFFKSLLSRIHVTLTTEVMQRNKRARQHNWKCGPVVHWLNTLRAT